jgi:hypothetical protein
VGSPEYLFVDGRGVVQSFQGITTAGSVAVKRPPLDGSESLEFVVAGGAAQLELRRPVGVWEWDDVRTRLSRITEADAVALAAFDVDGNPLETGPAKRLAGAGWSIPLVPGGVRYVLTSVGGRELK